MALGKKKGRGGLLRVMVMTDLTKDVNGYFKRPATFTAAALSLPEVTTSDIPLNVASTNDPTPVMYGTPAPGTGERWGDSEPGEVTWTASFSGIVQPVEADRAAMEALEVAAGQGKILWVERTPNGETKATGGAGFITQGSFPSPADGDETFSFTIQGRTKRWPDTSAATVAT